MGTSFKALHNPLIIFADSPGCCSATAIKKSELPNLVAHENTAGAPPDVSASDLGAPTRALCVIARVSPHSFS